MIWYSPELDELILCTVYGFSWERRTMHSGIKMELQNECSEEMVSIDLKNYAWFLIGTIG
jgi:hypothetical protein